MIEKIFRFKKANFDKLKKFGFIKNDDVFQFTTDIVDGEFEMQIFVTLNGKISAKVFDKSNGDEYVLHLTEDAVGEFVGKVRIDYENVLQNICDNCFESGIFSNSQTQQIISYIRQKYGDELEFLWKNFPTDAIWRRKDTNKWYGLLVKLPKNKLGLKGSENVDILNLKVSPEKLEKLLDNKSILHAYHMNKKHWITICLDGTVETQKITNLIDESYKLATK